MNDDHWERIFRWGPLSVSRSWPGIEGLHKSLMNSAQHHARIALRDFTKDGNLMVDSVLHAGLAVEQLAKCYLACHHPILLAERGCDVDTLLHLVGKSELAKSAPHVIKTIGAVEACRRTMRFLPTFRFNESADGAIFETRNSAGHIGIVHNVRGATRLMVKLSDPILVALEVETEQFWSPYEAVADLLRSETTSEQLAILNAKYAVARQQFAAVFAGLTPVEQAALKKALESRKLSSSDYEARYNCPSCGSQGWLICYRDYEFVEDADDEDGYRIIYPEPDAYPFVFECGVCDLRLDEMDMEVAGLPNRIDV